MSAVDDTAAALDFLVVRWNKDNSTERAKLLKWLQNAEDIIWNRSDWWFNRGETTIAVVNATATAATGSGTAAVLDILDHNGRLLNHVPPETFRSIYRRDTSTGTPEVWTIDSRATATGYLTVRWWPVPDASRTFTIVRKIVPATLTDSGSSVSNIPREYRTAHLDYALMQMAINEGQVAEAERFNSLFEQTIAAMREEDARQKGLVEQR